MKTIEIKGTAREVGGKKLAKQLRKQGMVPCNVYGEVKDENGLAKAFACALAEGGFRNDMETTEIYTVKLDVDGNQCLAILKEAQFHPVKDNVLHVDFYQITDEKPIVMEVPIKLNGLAVGVKAGGKLAASGRKLKVKAVHTPIPVRLELDVPNLELGKTIKVGELSFEGLELVTSPSVVVCQVKMTRNARSAASAEEA